MPVKIKLKNRESEYAVIDDMVLDDIKGNEYLMSLNFLDNLRAHSEGYPFFQKKRSTVNGLIHETIYLHKYIAQKFIPKPYSDVKLFITFKNRDVLNLTIDNLEWVPMSVLKRRMKHRKNRAGYRGVSEENGRFRATISNGGTTIHLGVFDNAKDAAKAYNKKSIELFGNTNSLNYIEEEKG